MCLLCGLNQKSAIRKDTKIRHLTRCEAFKKQCAIAHITTPYEIKQRAISLVHLLFIQRDKK